MRRRKRLPEKLYYFRIVELLLEMNIQEKLEAARKAEEDALDEKYPDYCNYNYNGFFDFIPNSASERFKVFKEYAAYQWFIQEKYHFLGRTFGEIDITYAKSKIEKLEKVRKHNLLTDKKERSTLYIEAVHYMSHIIARDSYKYKIPFTQRNILYNIILFEENYFERIQIPEQVFEGISAEGAYELLVLTYGEYFLFYEYLQSLLLRDESKAENNHHIKGEYKSLFEKPLWLGSDCKDFIINELTRRCEDIEMPFVTIVKGMPKWTKHNAHGQYAAGLLQVLSDKKLLDNGQISARKYAAIFKQTFNIQIDEKPFRQIWTNSVKEKYTRPFVKMLENIPVKD